MTKSIFTTEHHQKYLDEHQRLANLFATDRFAFEQERKRILDKAIDNMDTKVKRRKQQDEWDRLMKGIGSHENRFAMAQSLFYHHLINEWRPRIQEISIEFKGLKKIRPSQPLLIRVK